MQGEQMRNMKMPSLLIGAILLAPDTLIGVPGLDSLDADSIRRDDCAASGVRCVEEIMAKMTLREKVGQCVQIELDKISFGSPEETSEWFKRYPVGSIVKGPDVAGVANGGRLYNAEAIRRCVQASKTPLTIAGDLGPVTSPVKMPTFGAIGAVGDPSVARRWGRLVGRIGRANGYHWCYQPCVDIAVNWLNPIMGCRTFGNDPDKVARLAVEVVRGMQEEGLSASAKHWPGDGVDLRDQHLGPSVNSLPRGRWMDTYGKVYGALIAANVDSIMNAHISLPFADPPAGPFGLPPPAVMSKAITTDLLRGDLGYKGVVATDALMMGGFLIYRYPHHAQRYVEAFKAGADVLLWPRHVEVIDLMEKAVLRGEITMERLDASVRRILEMKVRQGLFDAPYSPSGVPSKELLDDARAFVSEVAEREIALVRNADGLLPLDRDTTKKVLLWIADPTEKGTVTPENYTELRSGFEERGAEVTFARNGNCLDLWKREDGGERYDAVFFLFRSGMHFVKNTMRPVGGAGECIWTMINSDLHRPIPITFSYPYLLHDAPWLTTLVNVHSDPSPETQRVLVRLLYGEIPFCGKSPFGTTVDLGVRK